MKPFVAIAASALLVAMMAGSGCGKCHDGSLKKASEKVEDALKIKVSVERQNPLKTELSESAKAIGLTMNIAKPLPPNDNGHYGFCAYLLSAKACRGQLVAKAMDKDGKEIGRAATDLDLDNDDARYFNFWFPAEMDQRKVEGFIIDLKK